jgi:DNA polymerase III subunit epsilon
MLNLTKPLVFLDLETTGVNPVTDKIIDVALLKVLPDGETEMKTWRVHPGISIPPATTKFHKITDEDVKDSPPFAKVATQILDFIGNADLAGYNSNKFDIPLLIEECLRARLDFDLKNRKLVDVQHIFHLMEPRNLSAAYKFYCNQKLENAHSAEADVRATYEILLEQVKKYEHIEIENKKGELVKPVQNNMQALSFLTGDNKVVDLVGRIVLNEAGVEVFNFGKYKDKPIEEVFKKEPSYYHWMMKGEFPLYTKKIITQIYLKSK